MANFGSLAMGTTGRRVRLVFRGGLTSNVSLSALSQIPLSFADYGLFGYSAPDTPRVAFEDCDLDTVETFPPSLSLCLLLLILAKIR